ncbi:Sulfotransferase family protein [Balnearium lithotrophicum]|uniref:Sulfotransferase family protein n=1 Tax=Balnearium lithotrophicum TaxID=223788 RepID=A0A521CA16_9BACT|nr:sulfotransferase [Balnearium lithotrophicum]SMO55570.1 Sulfotransferase family protein [Balnearium lithotrophicum]
MLSNKLKIIYIVGSGRSGSTLLERMLGQHEDVFAIGESFHGWERAFLKNQLCSCGVPFYECEIWKKIDSHFNKTLKKMNINFEKFVYLLKNTVRIRNYFFNRYKTNATIINKIYTEFYKSILEVSQKKYLIDSSKHPVLAHILSLNDNLELYFIHLIRDPRGVAYSWKKKKLKPIAPNKYDYMPQYPSLKTTVHWNVTNYIANKLVTKENVRYLRLKYEDLVSNPGKMLINIFKFLNLRSDSVVRKIICKENCIILHANHTLAGNPFRFKTGKVNLNLDKEWQEKLSFLEKNLIAFSSLPWLINYRYISPIKKGSKCDV